MKPKVKEIFDLSVSDAIANLNTISEMDIDLKEPLGFVKNNKLVLGGEDFSYKTIDMVIPEDASDLIENIKHSFMVVLEYFRDICEKDYIAYDDFRCKKGIEAIILMAAEAARRIDKYIDLLPKQPCVEKISESKEYLDLQKFYLENLKNKFPEEIEGAEAWEKEWENSEKSFLLDFDKSGLRDFESIKKDIRYELFYMLDEDENSFFDANLLNNLKVFTSFDEMSKEDLKDDPLLDIRILIDKDLQNSAKQILDTSKGLIINYFSLKSFKKIDSELNSLINKMIFALFLASNPANLASNFHYKSSHEYFYDFQTFLRNILDFGEYQKLITYIDDIKDKETKNIIDLVSNVCKNYFLKKCAIKQEVLGFIHRLSRQGANEESYKNLSYWSRLIQYNEDLSHTLEKYPNGPMLKTLDVIREEEPRGFDPSSLENSYSYLFQIKTNRSNIDILKAPSPTKQLLISDVEVNDEFKCFIRSFNKNEKYLIINLQDKDSDLDIARISALETLQKKTEFRDHMQIVSFDKDSNFYHQSANFLSLNKANEFKNIFIQNLIEPKSLFHQINDPNLVESIRNIIDFVHTSFFHKKETLSRKDRLDFIEITHNFLALKLIEIVKPKYFSFMCKDAVDTSSIAIAGFYGFLKILSNISLEKEDEEYIRYLSMSSALLIRERAVNSLRLVRASSSLNAFDMEMLVKHSKIKKDISSLYDPSFLKSIKINHF